MLHLFIYFKFTILLFFGKIYGVWTVIYCHKSTNMRMILFASPPVMTPLLIILRKKIWIIRKGVAYFNCRKQCTVTVRETRGDIKGTVIKYVQRLLICTEYLQLSSIALENVFLQFLYWSAIMSILKNILKFLYCRRKYTQKEENRKSWKI